MDVIRRPLSNKQPIPLTGGVVKFDFKKMDPKLGRSHLHVVGFIVKQNRDWKQVATTGPAVKADDLWYHFKDLLLRRDSTRVVMPNVQGHLVNALQRAMHQGRNYDPIPADIPANGTGAAVSTQQYSEQTIWLCDPDALEFDDGLWPLAAYIDAGELDINYDNPSVISTTAGISLDPAGNNDVDVDVLCVRRDVVNVGRDRRYQVIDNTGVGNVSGIVIPAGAVEWLVLEPPKAGGEDCTKYTSIKSLQDQPYRFPDQPAQSYNWDFLRSTSYRQFRDGTTASTLFADGTALMREVVLIGQVRGKKGTQNTLFLRRDMRLDVVVSSNVTGHRFLAVYVTKRDGNELNHIADKAQVPRQKRPPKKHKDPTKATNPAHPERKRLIAVTMGGH